MAKFKPQRIAAEVAPDFFPWARDDRDWIYGENGIYHPDTEAYHAPIETGHRLRVWDDTINEPHWGPIDDSGYLMGDLPAEPPGSVWRAVIDHGVDHSKLHDPEAYAAAGYPADGWHPGHTVVPDPRSKIRGKAYPTKEKAMRAAEKRFLRDFPIDKLRTMKAPAHSDSGVDYDSLINPGQEIDDDYGDIFGGGR